MVKDEFPWPRKGDRLFSAGVDWWNNACLAFAWDQWNTYATGYKEAADILVLHVAESGRQQDTLVYPVVFLYRQYLELTLKALIREGSKLFDLPCGPNDLARHDLQWLWHRCRALLERAWPDGPRDDLDAVQESLAQFANVDPYSTAFRYPIDRKGCPSLPGLTHINLRNLAEIMERLESLFDGCDNGLSAMRDAKQEWESHSR